MRKSMIIRRTAWFLAMMFAVACASPSTNAPDPHCIAGTDGNLEAYFHSHYHHGTAAANYHSPASGAT